MKIKVWRTKRAWRWYCPACDRTWSNHHRPAHVRLERLSPKDPRRVPAFQRTHKAVQSHLWRYHGGPAAPGRCEVRISGGPLRDQYVMLHVAHPTMLDRLRVPFGDSVYVYDLCYTKDREWFYLWSDSVAIPARRR